MKKILTFILILIIIFVAVIGVLRLSKKTKMGNENSDVNNTAQTGTKSFIGTVLEETTTYMVIEPNADEEERKSSDKIVINYGVDHLDYLYGVGRKVLITYSGDIMETYPAQINTNDIQTEI